MIAFAAVALLTMLRHEFWRDEIGLWLAARALPELGDYIHILEFGGHGRLWHVALWGLARLTVNPLAMQLLQLAVATAAVAVFVRHAPFPRWARAAFCFGYFPLFEFGVLARPYGVQMLLTVGACALFASRPRRPIALATVLGLLCWTTIYGAITACAMALAWLVDVRRASHALPSSPAAEPTLPTRGRVLCASAVFVFGLACGLIQMAPDADASYAAGIRGGWPHALHAARSVWNGLVPLPPPVVGFRNSTLLSGMPSVAAVVGVGLLAFVLWELRRERTALVLFAAGAAAHLLFTWLKFSGALRHHGALFLMLVAACWVAPPPAAEPRRVRTRTRLLALLLAAHAYGGIYAVVVDLVQPFSMSQAVAKYIQASPHSGAAVVAYPAPRTMPVIHTLGQPLYFADRREVMAYQYFSNDWAVTDTPTPFADAALFARAAGSGVLVLLAGDELVVPEDADLLARFDGSIEPSEQYRLFLVAPR